GALFRVAQHFVRLTDFLEALLGVRFLAHVRVVFAGELAIGTLDLVLRGAALDTEDFVVVAKFHFSGDTRREWTAGSHTRRRSGTSSASVCTAPESASASSLSS